MMTCPVTSVWTQISRVFPFSATTRLVCPLVPPSWLLNPNETNPAQSCACITLPLTASSALSVARPFCLPDWLLARDPGSVTPYRPGFHPEV